MERPEEPQLQLVLISLNYECEAWHLVNETDSQAQWEAPE